MSYKEINAAGGSLMARSARSGGFGRNTDTITITIDGGGSAITTSVPSMGGSTVVVPANCTITGWIVEADQSGSIVVDVKRANLAVPSASIVGGGGNPPTLSSAQFAGPVKPSSWTATTLKANDLIGFSVTSATTVQRVTVTLLIKYN